MDPASVEPLLDGSRLEGIVLSLRKPSNFCKHYKVGEKVQMEGDKQKQ